MNKHVRNLLSVILVVVMSVSSLINTYANPYNLLQSYPDRGTVYTDQIDFERFGFEPLNSASLLPFGWPMPTNIPLRNTISLEPWRTNINAGVTNWNNSGAGVRFVVGATGNNHIFFVHYDTQQRFGWVDVVVSGNRILMFDININADQIQNSWFTADVARVTQSTMAHELGHVIWLADNPPTSQPTIMSHSRNRNQVFTPQWVDIESVRRAYSFN